MKNIVTIISLLLVLASCSDGGDICGNDQILKEVAEKLPGAYYPSGLLVEVEDLSAISQEYDDVNNKYRCKADMTYLVSTVFEVDKVRKEAEIEFQLEDSSPNKYSVYAVNQYAGEISKP